MNWRVALCAALVAMPFSAAAFEPDLPTTARQLSDRGSPFDSYDLPVGEWSAAGVPVRAFEGRVQRRSWRITGGAVTTLQVLAPLRRQIKAEGYEVVFTCEDRACGGFDFRFAVEVIPAPDMHVDIRDYRFIAARRGESEAISLLVSRSRNAAYVQVIEVAPESRVDPPETQVRPSDPLNDPQGSGDVVAILLDRGHVVLADLEFETGSAALLPGRHQSLEDLAGYLRATPGQRIALVGHTDSIGGLEGNVALSKRRAAAARQRLIERHDVDPAQVDAEGMGYLAPIASNLTAQGRTVNRRVEAILLSGD